MAKLGQIMADHEKKTLSDVNFFRIPLQNVVFFAILGILVLAIISSPSVINLSVLSHSSNNSEMRETKSGEKQGG